MALQLNSTIYSGDVATVPTRCVSPWVREVHPIAQALASAFLADLCDTDRRDLCGMYGVLLASDGRQLHAMRAAPIELSKSLGLSALRLPAPLVDTRGGSVSIEAVFPRGVPDRVDHCPTARLVGHAVAQGWQPLVGTEFWFDGPDADGLRQHGRCYPACRGRCRPLVRAFVGDDAFDDMDGQVGGTGSLDPQLQVVFEDDHTLVIDKPAGLLSVPGLSEMPDAQSLVQAGYGSRALAAHRLDQPTSGLLMFAKTPGALRFLQRMFAERRVSKTYEAVLAGVPVATSGKIELPLCLQPLDRPRQTVDHSVGKPSMTTWRALEQAGSGMRIEMKPLTGRTHQLRVHAAHRAGLGMPIVGDELYGWPSERLLLHARDMVVPQLHDPEPRVLHAPVPF